MENTFMTVTPLKMRDGLKRFAFVITIALMGISSTFGQGINDYTLIQNNSLVVSSSANLELVVELINLEGKKILTLEKSFTSGIHEINLKEKAATLNDGMYIMAISKNGSSFKLKVIVANHQILSTASQEKVEKERLSAVPEDFAATRAKREAEVKLEKERAKDNLKGARQYNTTDADHLITNGWNEIIAALNSGFRYEGFSYFMNQSAGNGRVPFYRLYNDDVSDHYYTGDYNNAVNVANSGYSFQGISGYIYPYQASGTIPLYELYSASTTDHLYTSSYDELVSAQSVGYQFVVVAGYVPNTQQSSDQQPYSRLLSGYGATTPSTNSNGIAGSSHFYTTDYNEIPNAGFNYEGVACRIFSNPGQGDLPLFRLTNQATNDHFYVTNWTELNFALNYGYRFEAIIGYVYSTQQWGSIPLYRMFDPIGQRHFYTANYDEFNSLINSGFIVEGIACYVPQDGDGTIALHRGSQYRAPAPLPIPISYASSTVNNTPPPAPPQAQTTPQYVQLSIPYTPSPYGVDPLTGIPLKNPPPDYVNGAISSGNGVVLNSSSSSSTKNVVGYSFNGTPVVIGTASNGKLSTTPQNLANLISTYRVNVTVPQVAQTLDNNINALNAAGNQIINIPFATQTDPNGIITQYLPAPAQIGSDNNYLPDLQVPVNLPADNQSINNIYNTPYDVANTSNPITFHFQDIPQPLILGASGCNNNVGKVTNTFIGPVNFTTTPDNVGLSLDFGLGSIGGNSSGQLTLRRGATAATVIPYTIIQANAGVNFNLAAPNFQSSIQSVNSRILGGFGVPGIGGFTVGAQFPDYCR